MLLSLQIYLIFLNNRCCFCFFKSYLPLIPATVHSVTFLCKVATNFMITCHLIFTLNTRTLNSLKDTSRNIGLYGITYVIILANFITQLTNPGFNVVFFIQPLPVYFLRTSSVLISVVIPCTVQ